MEIANVFEHISKDKFKSAANKLLGECFLLKKHKDTASDYNYILNNKDAFIEYFDILGYELIIDEQNGVIGLNNPLGTGRIHLKKIESILLLILRLLYIEKRKQLSQIDDVIIIADEIYDKYSMLKMNAKLDKTAMRNTLGMFQRYHLIGKLDADMSNPDTRILIYPSILFAVTVSSLDDLYQSAKDKLDKYSIGGDSFGTNDSADNEETDEN
ncbi:MAG: hypothetical protein DBX53_03845 [Clostridiales bacterium]|jgi:hypothetical protein|nr:MAG: hypothetical protein DBX53_03845 [Clostridiales bacterium]